MQISKNIKIIIVVLIGIIPFYAFAVIDKVFNQPNISIQGFFLIYMPITAIALFILFLLNKYFLKQTIASYNVERKNLLSDIAVMFILLVGASFIQITFNLFLKDALPSRQDNTKILSALQEIFTNPFYALVFLIPFIWITQSFLIFSRIFLLKNLWELSKNKIWIWSVVILSSILFVLPEIDKSILSILISFSVILFFNITYFFYRRFYPLIFAAIFYQTIQMLDFWITFPG